MRKGLKNGQKNVLKKVFALGVHLPQFAQIVVQLKKTSAKPIATCVAVRVLRSGALKQVDLLGSTLAYVHAALKEVKINLGFACLAKLKILGNGVLQYAFQKKSSKDLGKKDVKKRLSNVLFEKLPKTVFG